MKAYDRVTYHGKTMNHRTMLMVQEAEKRLGYELTIIQGSYNKGVGASAGTHDGGGALDLAPYDWYSKVMVLRRIGFAAWYRPAIAGLWSAHIHAIAIGDKEMDPTAYRQVQAYYAGRDGLASNGPDPHGGPLKPQPVFQYPLPVAVFSTIWFQMHKAKTKKPTRSVRLFQRALKKKVDSNIVVDGIAGRQTKRAWKKYRLRHAGVSAFRTMRRLGKNVYTLKK